MWWAMPNIGGNDKRVEHEGVAKNRAKISYLYKKSMSKIS